MHDNLIELQIDINMCVHEIYQFTNDIKLLDEMIMDGTSPYSDDEAKMEMEEIIEGYKKQVNKARILLESYFAEERKLGEPTDFLYRRLYSKLKDAY